MDADIIGPPQPFFLGPRASNPASNFELNAVMEWGKGNEVLDDCIRLLHSSLFPGTDHLLSRQEEKGTI